MAKHTPPPGWKNPLAPQQPLTSPHWIAGAVAATLLIAGLCVYITFCLLFWQGQWQLVFKPSATVGATPASVGLGYDEIRFDSTETGTLQLDGWWIPAAGKSTLLLLHGGTGSLSDTVPQLQGLHRLGVNVLAFDYRGFGKSVAIHPSEASTYEDAEAAWRYLTETRHVPPGTIILYGDGLGAAIAAKTASDHPEAAALILLHPQPPTLDSLPLDPAMHLLPIHLLFDDRFDPTGALGHLHTPKLFVYSSSVARYYDGAADPKEKVVLMASDESCLYLRSFLEKHVPGW